MSIVAALFLSSNKWPLTYNCQDTFHCTNGVSYWKRSDAIYSELWSLHQVSTEQLSRLAGNVRAQRDMETLKAENDTSPLFPSNDLPDVKLLCSRSHYSSVIEQNTGAQWLHKTSGAREREEEKGGSRSTMLRFWNHPHFSKQGKVEVILYFCQGTVLLFFSSSKRETESPEIVLPDDTMSFFELLANTCLQKRAGHNCTKPRIVPLSTCMCACTSLCICWAVLYQIFFSL